MFLLILLIEEINLMPTYPRDQTTVVRGKKTSKFVCLILKFFENGFKDQKPKVAKCEFD